MTVPYLQALAAIKMNAPDPLRLIFEGLSLAEAVELGTFIGPDRPRAVALRPVTTTALRPPGEPLDTPGLLAEISRQAFNAPIAFTQAIVPDKAMNLAIATALLDVAQRRTVAPLLTMTEDVTDVLPTPAGVPAALSQADYEAAAQRNNVEVAAIKAVATVESGGRSGFDAQGRPKILFEAHHFGPLSGNRFNRTHPHLACAAGELSKARRYYGWDQYERLREAMVLDIDAALKAASWGKFQVLGEYHSGWPDVRSFVAAMYVSEENHLRSFEAHCNASNLFRYARAKDWLGFARGYNGPRQQGYDGRIAQAYAAAGGR